MADPCRQTMPVMKDSVAPCSGMLTTTHILRKALTCKTVDVPRLQADLKLCRVKVEQAKAYGLLAECSLPNDGVSPLTATLLSVTSLTVGLIVGWVLVPDFSMP